jgi:hypothetical protein
MTQGTPIIEQAVVKRYMKMDLSDCSTEYESVQAVSPVLSRAEHVQDGVLMVDRRLEAAPVP